MTLSCVINLYEIYNDPARMRILQFWRREFFYSMVWTFFQNFFDLIPPFLFLALPLWTPFWAPLTIFLSPGTLPPCRFFLKSKSVYQDTFSISRWTVWINAYIYPPTIRRPRLGKYSRGWICGRCRIEMTWIFPAKNRNGKRTANFYLLLSISFLSGK